MIGNFVQMIALATYGNAYLSGERLPDGFYPRNKVFRSSGSVNFRDGSGDILTDSPPEWFEHIKDKGCVKLRVYHQGSSNHDTPDHMLAGFVGGGGTWLIEAVYPEFSDMWIDRWTVSEDKSEKTSWIVNYILVAEKRPSIELPVAPDNVKHGLNEAFTQISLFAYEQGLNHFGEIFERANEQLNNEDPQFGEYSKNLFPPGEHPLIKRQLFAAVQAGWVFGGMGSWNDLGFYNKETNVQYAQVSADLYSAINRAITCVVNCSFDDAA